MFNFNPLNLVWETSDSDVERAVLTGVTQLKCQQKVTFSFQS